MSLLNRYSYVLVALVLLFSNVVHAQTVSSLNWSSSTYYQGDSGSVSVNLYNAHSYSICTKQFYVQFDWQAQGTAFISSATPCIGAGQSYQFNIPISFPTSTSVGQHTYSITWIDQGYLLGTVIVNSGSLYVHDAYEKVYLATASTVSSSITQAQSSNYQSPTAISDLSQAVSIYNQGVTLANQGQFQSAVSDLNQAQTLLSQASAAQQSYQPPIFGGSGSGGTDSNGTLVVGVIIIIVVIAVAYGLSKRNKGGREVTSHNRRNGGDNEHLKTLKSRYAKGEITKRQYDQMRADLE